MKSLASWFVLTIVLSVASANAQVASTPAIQLNTIYAGADGKFESAPDTAVIRMDVASQQDTSRAAYDHAAMAVDHVRQVLKSNGIDVRSEEHTSELQSQFHLVCRLLLEKKKTTS